MALDLVGRSLGHFRVASRLGEGGMGVVYSALDERLRRTVALKVLRPEVASDVRRRSRFLREARFAAALSHPNVCTVHEVGESDGLVYIAMELVEGTSLRRLLASGRLPLGQALAIARDVARALARAHEKKIVHRDLKPENVVVYEPNPHVLAAKVLDFGLAKALDGPKSDQEIEHEVTDTFVTAQGVALGTPGYMSPEQARGLSVDARSDVFSFGVMFYEMLSGVRPFQGKTREERLLAVGSDDAARLETVMEDCPAPLDELVMRCLAKSPTHRFQDGTSIVRPLEALCDRLARARTASVTDASYDAQPAPAEVVSATMTESAHVVPASQGVPTESLEALERVAPARVEASSMKPAPPPTPLLRRAIWISVGLIMVTATMSLKTLLTAPAQTAPAATPTASMSAFEAASDSASATVASVVPVAPRPPAVPVSSSPASAHAAPRPAVRHAPPRAPTATPTAPAPLPFTSPSALDDCSEKFIVDKDGVRIPKRECFRK